MGNTFTVYYKGSWVISYKSLNLTNKNEKISVLNKMTVIQESLYHKTEILQSDCTTKVNSLTEQSFGHNCVTIRSVKNLYMIFLP